MKNDIDDFIENSLTSLSRSSSPTTEQKEAILNKVLIRAEAETLAKKPILANLIFDYPWRFALGLSTVQAILSVAVFGSRYTNLILKFIGR
jgi:hypothetical protein